MQRRSMDRRRLTAVIMEGKKVHRVLFPETLFITIGTRFIFSPACAHSLSLFLSLPLVISCSWQPWFIGCKSRWNNTPCQFLWLLHYCFFTNLQWLKSVLLFDRLSKYRRRRHENENGWVPVTRPEMRRGIENSKNI